MNRAIPLGYYESLILQIEIDFKNLKNSFEVLQDNKTDQRNGVVKIFMQIEKEDYPSFKGFFKTPFNFFPALKCAFFRAGTFIEVFLKCNVYNDYLL